jgi:hypothetical protein
MFSPEFRERLRLGKYSRWAVNLTEAQLEAIIWMIGEFGYRADFVLPLLTEHWNHEGSGRAANALESLFRVVGGDRPDLSQYTKRVRDFLAEVRGLVEEPDGVPAHRWAVEWKGQLAGWIALPALDEYGNCSGPWWPGKAATEFLAEVAEPPEDGVRVVLGGIPGWVRSPPDESGRMAFWLHVSPNAYELLQLRDADRDATTDDSKTSSG